MCSRSSGFVTAVCVCHLSIAVLLAPSSFRFDVPIVLVCAGSLVSLTEHELAQVYCLALQGA